MFKLPNATLISRRLIGEFLNYRTSIPQTAKYRISTDRREFSWATERVSIVLSDKQTRSPLRLTFTDKEIILLAQSAIGQASDRCRSDGDGENLEFGVNHRFLLDALRAIEDDEVTLKLTTSKSPCVIVPKDGEDSYLYVVMPIKLSSNIS